MSTQFSPVDIKIENAENQNKFSSESTRPGIYEKYIKRILDFTAALICIPVAALIIIVVSPLLIIDDGLPVFYNAERIGRNGKLFKMYKLRSMKNNSPDIRTETGDTYNSEDDPRVTKIGKLLRKTSIDEIPQLLNVLKGEMSIIGPRPDTPDWLEKYSEDEREFLKLRPGITGYSQVYFRNSADAALKMQNDIYYVRNCSFILDVKILFKTIGVVLKHENVYRK